MRTNTTRRLLGSGLPAIGTFCFLADPDVVEIAGLAGFDFVIIDVEHAGKDFQTIEAMVRAAEVQAITPLVRVPDVNEKAILQVLETGVQGIVVPFVGSAETARRAARSVRYPPAGSRGTCRSTRAASYGLYLDRFDEHMRSCNEEVLLVGMIEDRDGVDQVDAILAEGIDVCFLGRADLSTALGRPGQLDHPDVLEASDRVLAAVKKAGKVAGNMAFSAADARKSVEQGYRFIVYATDTQVLMRGFQTGVKQIRSVLGESAAGYAPESAQTAPSGP